MNIQEKAEKAKIIAIGENGIKTLDSIKNEIEKNMSLEKISINQEVDKDYVRELLDGVDLLFLAYDSEDKKALQIVNAIGYMADERRILSIGIDSASKENTDEVNLNTEFKINESSKDKLVNLMNMLIESISYLCMINIDLTDLKETLCTDSQMKYSFGEFDKQTSKEDIVNYLLENTNEISKESIKKNQIIFIEIGQSYCDEKDMMLVINDILTNIQEKTDSSYESIFSLYRKEETNDKIKVGLISN